MRRIIVISSDAYQVDHWQKIFDRANLGVALERQPADYHFPAGQTDLCLLLYHMQDTPDKTGLLINCLEQKPDQLPVVLVTANPQTRLFLQFEYLGTRDVVSTSDDERLTLVVRRELEFSHLNHELVRLRSACSAESTQAIDISDNATAYIMDGMHMYANAAYARLFGFENPEELASRPLLDLVADDYQPDFRRFIQQLGIGSGEQPIEVACKHQDGLVFKGLLVFSEATFEGEDCLQLQVENLEFEHKARLLRDQDPDTGLNSRQHFMRDLQTLFSRKDPDNQQFSLLYILVDGFDELKQKHGLLKTDLLLAELAGILRAQAKTNMQPYRYGDHAFCMVIESDNPQLSRVVAETLIRLVNEHTSESLPDILSPTLSIGISNSTSVETGEAEIMANHMLEYAYQACRTIYENAGNGYMDYVQLVKIREEQNSIASIDDTTHLKELIGYAIDHDRFRLLYQPVVSTHGHTGEYYSVLLRLLDHDNQEIRPKFFVRQAISYGLMQKIDRWVIKHAIESLAIQRRNGNRVHFFIQLSQSAINDDMLLLWIVDCLRDNNAKGAWITFQFHYPDIRKQQAATEKLFQGLKKINCGIAINQFENTSNAFQLVDSLPVDFLKLGKNLVSQILANHSDAENFLQHDDLRNKREINTIAHDIENADDLVTAWSSGIHFVQGAYLHEPVATINA